MTSLPLTVAIGPGTVIGQLHRSKRVVTASRHGDSVMLRASPVGGRGTLKTVVIAAEDATRGALSVALGAEAIAYLREGAVTVLDLDTGQTTPVAVPADVITILGPTDTGFVLLARDDAGLPVLLHSRRDGTSTALRRDLDRFPIVEEDTPVAGEQAGSVFVSVSPASKKIQVWDLRSHEMIALEADLRGLRVAGAVMGTSRHVVGVSTGDPVSIWLHERFVERGGSGEMDARPGLLRLIRAETGETVAFYSDPDARVLSLLGNSFALAREASGALSVVKLTVPSDEVR